jgi:hypothetical protein
MDYISLRSYTMKITSTGSPPEQPTRIIGYGFVETVGDGKHIIVRPKWISLKDDLPKLSYSARDNEDNPYECYPVLLYCPEQPGIQCVGYLVREEDKTKFDYGDLAWEVYVPGNAGNILDIDFDVFSHWTPLPTPPES